MILKPKIINKKIVTCIKIIILVKGAIGWKAVQGTWVFKCGSTLISPKFTLTAAHCTRAPPDPRTVSEVPQIIRFGEKNIIDVVRTLTITAIFFKHVVYQIYLFSVRSSRCEHSKIFCPPTI